MAQRVLLALCLLLLPSIATACLHWVPEEELEPDDDDTVVEDDDDTTATDDDDTTAPDDDDTTVPDDDDATPEESYEADAIGIVIINDDLEGQPTGETIVGALFSPELLTPSAEEALAQQIWGVTMPLFAMPGEPRTVPAGDRYEVDSINVGQPLFMNSGADSVALGPIDDGGYMPFEGFWLPDLVEGDASWTLQVPAEDSGYGGFHPAPPLPEAAKPEFLRAVGDRVYLLAGETLSAGIASGGGDSDLMVLHAGPDRPAVAVRVDPDGTVALDSSQIPPELLEIGWVELGWYRAERVLHDLEGGLLSLVTGRWTDLDLALLPPGVGYASTEPVELPANMPLEFVIRLEGISLPPDEIPEVQVGGQQAAEVGWISTTEIEVLHPDGLTASGLQDVWVSWPGGAAQGATILAWQELPCDLTESEPNDLASQAHFFVPGLVACGTTNPATDVDTYRFSVAAGDTLVFETLANRLGLPTDTTLTLLDMSGNQEAWSDDDAGMWDSLIVWTAPAAGQYLLQVASFQNQVGGPGYDYQLLTSIQ